MLGPQVMKGAGNRAVDPKSSGLRPVGTCSRSLRVANPHACSTATSRLFSRSATANWAYVPPMSPIARRAVIPSSINAIYAARVAMTLVIAHDAEHVASALAMVIARRCSPRKGQEKRTISVTQFEDRCVCFHPSTGFPSSRPRRRTTDLAMMISSSVRMTRTATRPPSFENAALVRGRICDRLGFLWDLIKT